MANYINGCGYPIIELKSTARNLSYNLPLCMEEGMTEDWRPQHQRYETVNLAILISDIQRPIRQKFIGYRGYFNLDYKSWKDKTEILNFETFINIYHSNLYDMWLTPRNDAATRKFKVNLINESEILGILHGGTTAIGNKGIEFKFETVDLYPTKNYRDPDAVEKLIKISTGFQYNLVT